MYKPIYIYLHVVSNNNKIYEKRKIVKVKIKEERRKSAVDLKEFLSRVLCSRQPENQKSVKSDLKMQTE